MSEEIRIERDKVVRALKHLEMIVPSLDRLGSAAASMSREEYVQAAASFLEDWDVARRLADVRRILSESFPDEPGPDGMDDLERELEDIACWTTNSRTPPPEQ